MKNTQRFLTASQAEKIRKILEEEYINLSIMAWEIDDDRHDDPGDWEADTARLKEIGGRIDRIQEAIDYIGGLDQPYVHDEICKWM